MTIKIKEWKVNQINEECHKYHMTLVRHDNNDGSYSLDLTEAIIKETEKAIYVSVQAATYSDNYRDFRTWIPKSCIVA